MKRLALLAFVAFLVSVPLWVGSFYMLHVLIVTGIFIIAAMSLNLLLGYTGQLSLGHVAFFGIGAYVSAFVSLGFSVHLLPDVAVTLEPQPPWLGALSGIVVAGLFGFAIGKVAFKVRGAYFVIVTISFAEVVRLVALNWDELTQGPMALNNIPALSLGWPGFEITFIGKVNYYYLVLGVAIIAYVIIARIVHSRAGRAMIALKENEALAASVGVDVTRYLVLATVVSAAIAGAAGVLYAHYVRIVDPNIFLFIYTVTMVIMVVAGGKGMALRSAWSAVRLRPSPRIPALARGRARAAMGHLRRLDDPRRLPLAARHRAGARRARPASPRRSRFALRRRGQCQRGGAMTGEAAAVALAVEGLSIRFGGLTAVEEHELRRQGGRGVVADRPEWRRQDLGLQRHHRLFAGGQRDETPGAIGENVLADKADVGEGRQQ